MDRPIEHPRDRMPVMVVAIIAVLAGLAALFMWPW